MRFMDQISSGQALLFSAITGGPSIVWATINDDFAPVATGAAVGSLAFLLTLWRSSNDSRFQAILDRLDKAEKEAGDYRARWTASEEEAAVTKVALARVAAQVKGDEDRVSMWKTMLSEGRIGPDEFQADDHS